MVYFNSIRILGSSHISIESIQLIKSVIKVERPDIVAVELDKRRLDALFSKEAGIDWRIIWKIGARGFIFALIGSYIQKKLGKLVGVMPGEDMATAAREAKANNIRLELIDQNIEITLARFSAAINWREKWHFVVDVFRAIFFRKREIQRLGLDKLDLTKVPSEKIIEKMIEEIKIRYPNIYGVLIDERDKFMASKLHILLANNPGKKILAVVGAGHEKGMIRALDALRAQKNANAGQ